MESGDGLLVRVQAPDARLRAWQARGLADAAERCGSGVIELTQRGNLQVRGLRAGTIGAFAGAMGDVGLVSPGPVLPPPLLGDDPGLDAGAAGLTARVMAALAGFKLPQKFTVAIDGGGILSGRAVAADLVARADGLGLAEAGEAPAPVGMLGYPGTGFAAFGLAAPFGQLDAAMLRAAAASAERHDTALRVTPWRVLLLGRVSRTARIEAGAGWIVDPGDPRLLVSACIGAAGCVRGTTRTRMDAARLRPMVRTHVSGCLKGCAHPGAAPVTYVGRDGGYDLVLNGRAGDVPSVVGVVP